MKYFRQHGRDGVQLAPQQGRPNRSDRRQQLLERPGNRRNGGGLIKAGHLHRSRRVQTQKCPTRVPGCRNK